MILFKLRGETLYDTAALWINIITWHIRRFFYYLFGAKGKSFYAYVREKCPNLYWSRFPIKLEGRFYYYKKMKAWIDWEGYEWYRLDTPVQHPAYWLDKIKTSQIGLDVGAHRGYWSIFYGRSISNTGYIFCLEPNPKNYRQLLFNLAKNNFYRAIPMPLAAWKENAILYLEITEYSSMGGQVREFGRGDRVLGVSIDNLVRGLGLPQVDWIKLDIEGAEVNALQGAAHTIRTYQPTLWVEYHQNRDLVIPTLQELGYIVREEVNFGNGQGYLWAEPQAL